MLVEINDDEIVVKLADFEILKEDSIFLRMFI